MRLVDADKLYPDKMTVEGSLAISQGQLAHAKTVKAIPLDRIKKAREEIQQAHEDLDGYNPQAVWDYISHVDEILDKLIAESEGLDDKN